MADLTSVHRVEISKLILVPSLITLAVTVLRVVGELENWSPVFFRKQAGGGGAIVGISWLPIIFGIYFALKLREAGAGPASLGRTYALWGLGLLLLVGGGYLGAMAFYGNSPIVGLGALALMVGAIVVPFWGWTRLTQALVAYAYAARIPVLIVMFLAFRGHWGTHYDALPPGFVSKGFARDFLNLAVIPQMFLWIAFTLLVGTLCGALAVTIVPHRRPVTPTA